MKPFYNYENYNTLHLFFFFFYQSIFLSIYVCIATANSVITTWRPEAHSDVWTVFSPIFKYLHINVQQMYAYTLYMYICDYIYSWILCRSKLDIFLHCRSKREHKEQIFWICLENCGVGGGRGWGGWEASLSISLSLPVRTFFCWIQILKKHEHIHTNIYIYLQIFGILSKKKGLTRLRPTCLNAYHL